MKLKRLVAFFLVMTMTVGSLPALVFADENDGAPNETKVVESSEPEEKKPSKPAETKPAETKPAETKPQETKPAETKPAETTVKETEQPEETKPAETTASETTKPESTKPAEPSETEKEMPETTEPAETREKAPVETGDERTAKSGKSDETEPDGKEDGRQEVNIIGKSKSYTYVPSDKSDNEELFRRYIERKFSASKSNTKNTDKRTAKSVLSGSGLTGNDKKAYDALKAQIVLVAEGKRSSTKLTVSISDLGIQDGAVYTAEQFGVESLVQDEDVIDELKAVLQAQIEVDWNKVIDALLADCPYELYWYKKNASTHITGIHPKCSGYTDELSVTWIPTEFEIDFPVAEPYYADDYQTDPFEVIRANKAVSNAASIVESAKSKSDYEKLVFYIDEICKRVSYDKNAAQSGNDLTMDPWQLISVFDDDSSSNVVCEGYSKAFKYLCDLTKFKKDISCIVVVGTLKTPNVTGPHMWNLVTMDDGKNYLVDVTHCDAGDSGDPTMMFLRGYSSGDVSSGYVCYLGSTSFLYEYDDTNLAFTPDQLTISDKDYKVGGTVIDSGTCGTNLTWKLNDMGTLTISGTGAMTDWTTPDNLPWISHRYDIREIVISDGVTTIGDRAFCGLQNVRSVEIPDGVASIGYGAFQNCAITSIDIPGSVTAIKGEAFYSCGQLKSLAIPESVESIGIRAFALCGSLETVVIPEKITSLGAGAFSDCSGLVSVVLNRQAYSESAFPGIPTSKLHYYYKVTYASVSHGTVSGKTETYGSDIVELTIEPAPGYDLKELTWSTASGTPAELKPGTDGKYVMPDSNDDIIITPVFMFGAGYVLSGNSVFRSSASDAVVRFMTNTEGTYYYVVNSSSTAPSAADIKAAGSGVYGNGPAAGGTNSISITGMSSGKQYCHIAMFDGDYSSNVITFEMPYDFYYFDDFNSYLTNTKVSSGKTPFTVLYDGTGDADQKIIGAVQKNGKTDRVLQLQGASGWASNVQCNIAPDNKQFLVIEIDIKAVSGNSPGGVVIGSAQGGSKTICVHCLHNGTFQYGIGDVSNYVDSKETYSIGKWYELKIVLDRTNNVFYSFADGKRVGYGLATSAFTPDWFVLSAGNNGTNTTYYDNVRCYSTDNVEIDKNIYSWSDLQAALNMGGSIKLTQDITAGTGDTQLYTNKTVVLDLNGYVINRNLKAATKDGGVIFVDEPGNLTIIDSRPDATHSPAIKYKDLTTGNDVVVKGGIITGGYNTSGAGGIYFKWSSGTINGGTIVGNKSCGTDVYGNAGGLVIRSSTVTMNGGAICGNEAVYGNGDTVVGGVFLNDLQGSVTVFNINGGLITGNYTNSTEGSCLGGVHTYAGKINISGNPQIYGNMKNGMNQNMIMSNTTKGRVIDITGLLTDGARIEVTTWRIPLYYYSPEAFTDGFGTYNKNEHPSKYFTLDDDKAIMVFDDSGEAKVALKFALTITTDGNGTATLDPTDTDIYYGLHPTLTATPNTGYVFKEWQVLSGKATIDKNNKISVDAEDADNPVTDINIKAVFEKQTFTVTFADGTSTISTASVIYGETVTKPSDPVKNGYRFDNWYADSAFNTIFDFANTKIEKNTTVYAKFSQKFNVTFVDGTNTLNTVTVFEGEKVTKPSDPVKDGYSFINWYSDPKFENEFDFDSAICKETTIYARFLQEFNIAVTSGEADKTKAFESEEVKVTAGAAPTGYVFDKWESVTGTVVFADPNSVETTFNMPAENVEVKATYKIVSGNCGENDDNLTWTIDYATGTLTISGNGNMKNWGDADSVPWYSARESIKAVVISDGVTSIGNRAFIGYSNITKVTIEGKVDTIGYWAFSKCTGIESVVLPEGTTTINAGAFSGCTGLTNITIPGSIAAIGDNVFNGCTSLTDVTYTGTKETWDNVSIGSGNDSLINATMQFAKSDNTLSVKGKTAKVKYSKLRKKKQTLTVGKVIAFTNRGQGTLTYIKVSGSKKVSINKTTGKVTIKKKGLKKKKTYSIKVKVMASGNDNYNASTWKTVTFKIKVK